MLEYIPEKYNLFSKLLNRKKRETPNLSNFHQLKGTPFPLHHEHTDGLHFL